MNGKDKNIRKNPNKSRAIYFFNIIFMCLLTLASILRIPVCMHNIPDDEIFRPAAWNAFGMDKEGADFRACANFGPLYK